MPRKRKEIQQEALLTVSNEFNKHKITAEQAAEKLNVSRRTFFRRIKEQKAE